MPAFLESPNLSWLPDIGKKFGLILSLHVFFFLLNLVCTDCKRDGKPQQLNKELFSSCGSATAEPLHPRPKERFFVLVHCSLDVTPKIFCRWMSSFPVQIALVANVGRNIFSQNKNSARPWNWQDWQFSRHDRISLMKPFDAFQLSFNAMNKNLQIGRFPLFSAMNDFFGICTKSLHIAADWVFHHCLLSNFFPICCLNSTVKLWGFLLQKTSSLCEYNKLRLFDNKVKEVRSSRSHMIRSGTPSYMCPVGQVGLQDLTHLHTHVIYSYMYECMIVRPWFSSRVNLAYLPSRFRLVSGCGGDDSCGWDWVTYSAQNARSCSSWRRSCCTWEPVQGTGDLLGATAWRTFWTNFLILFKNCPNPVSVFG